MTDEEFNRARAKQAEMDAKCWGHADGPAWLKDALAAPTDTADDLALQQRALKWADGRGISVASALQLACTEIEKRSRQLSQLDRLDRLIWDAASEERAFLAGFPIEPNRSLQKREEASRIPPTFFCYPVQHTMGISYHGNGVIGPLFADSKEVFEAIFGGNSVGGVRPNTSFALTKIRRLDALQIKIEFDANDTKRPSTVGKLSRTECNLFEATQAEVVARGGNTAWLEGSRRDRDLAIWSQLHRIGRVKQPQPPNLPSFQRTCRAFFANLPLSSLLADIPD